MYTTTLPASAAAAHPVALSLPTQNSAVRRPRCEPAVSRGKGPIRILVADDHPVVRRGMSSCLARHEHLMVAGEAADGREAVAKARELLPDVVLLDIDMPGMSGVAVSEVLRRELPRVKVLILSMHERAEYLLRILQSGARGYVLKQATTEELVKAIELVHAGETFFSPEIARLALNQFVQGTGNGPSAASLTYREREVLVLIADGLSNKEIATKLNVGVRTAETHRERIMRKLDIHTIAGLTRFAIAKGLITLREEAPR